MPGAITGNVSDTNSNGLAGVQLRLLDSNGIPLNDSNGTSITTTTDSNGSYSFTNLAPGEYQVAQTLPSGYNLFSEADGGTDGDNPDNGLANNIPVTLDPGETDTGNDFVDAPQPGFIVGNVSDAYGLGLVNVELRLLDSNGIPVTDSNGASITSTTDNNGNYTFSNLLPGHYQIAQTQPTGYTNLSEVDGGADGDNPDNGLANNIPVTLDPGETDIGNSFVELANPDVIGSALADSLTGDANPNVIAGLKGQDTLSGGAGDDLFFFNETSDGLDLLPDFNQFGNDKLVLTQIFATELSSYTGNDPFADGYLVLTPINHPTLGSSTLVQIDFDAGDESSPADLFHKDIAFLPGVDAASLSLANDFIL